MVRTADLEEYGNAVKDLVHCAQCGTPMELSGNQFRCPRSRNSGAADCQSVPTGTEVLLDRVMTCLIDRLMTEGVTQAVVGAAYGEINQELGDLEGQIRDNRRRMRTLERERRRYDASSADQEEQARRIDSEVEALESQLGSLRDQAQAAPFLRDQERIAETARDPRTYLDNALPSEARELIGTFVEEIRVGPDSVELVYLRGLPDEKNGTSITAEAIVLQ